MNWMSEGEEKSMKVNLVIVGSGGAAAAAALSAHESGMREIVIVEKDTFSGVSTAIS
jgi:succinate dehydrogenase/fumarate reductase flavoprotein subunit